jgi:hypothetical protein
LLNATRAWLPTWNPEWVFYGKNTTRPTPVLEAEYVQISDSIIGTYPTFSGTGILGIIEFEITYAPTTSEVSCSLNINNADTFLLDPTTNEISSATTNGYYEHKTVKVEAQPTEMALYIVTGIITVAIIVAVAIYLAKIRKPHK